MKPFLHRVLMAYRPLYLHGLLVDGQYRRPPPACDAAVASPSRLRLVAVTGLRPSALLRRSRR